MRLVFLSGLCVVTASFGSAVPAAHAEGSDLAGAYKCLGDAGDGKQYEGKVEIAKLGDCYRVEWTIGAQRYHGIGMREGDVLSVAIRDDADDKYTGLIVYRIGKAGRLKGRWTTSGFKGETLTEMLTPDE